MLKQKKTKRLSMRIGIGWVQFIRISEAVASDFFVYRPRIFVFSCKKCAFLVLRWRFWEFFRLFCAQHITRNSYRRKEFRRFLDTFFKASIFPKNWSFSDFKDFKIQKNFAIEKIFFTCYNYLKEPSWHQQTKNPCIVESAEVFCLLSQILASVAHYYLSFLSSHFKK